ncbi:MAG: hypothetical protein JMDDDDMK_02869 [Acidobacteria bacterium]|nr:hypothetical protein [Acidobacteriota bacterium]
MTTAVNEIFKQAELLSAAEQSELAKMLLDQARLKAATSPDQLVSQEDAVPDEDADEDTEEPLDVFSLEVMPPKWVYTAQAQYHFVGRGEPLPYDFRDFFDDEVGSGE